MRTSGSATSSTGFVFTAWTMGMVAGALVVARRVPATAMGVGVLIAVAVQGAGLGLPTVWLVVPFGAAMWFVGRPRPRDEERPGAHADPAARPRPPARTGLRRLQRAPQRGRAGGARGRRCAGQRDRRARHPGDRRRRSRGGRAGRSGAVLARAGENARAVTNLRRRCMAPPDKRSRGCAFAPGRSCRRPWPRWRPGTSRSCCCPSASPCSRRSRPWSPWAPPTASAPSARSS